MIFSPLFSQLQGWDIWGHSEANISSDLIINHCGTEKRSWTESVGLICRLSLPLAVLPGVSRFLTYDSWLFCWASAFLVGGQRHSSKGQPCSSSQASSLFIYHPPPFYSPILSYTLIALANTFLVVYFVPGTVPSGGLERKSSRGKKKDKYYNV